mgnify:CR=1 FL=1
MAIIYSYPVVDPTLNDLVLGTDVDAQGKPTKNFTIQSIVSLIQGSATGLEAVLADSPDGGGLNILNIGNITGSGVSTSGSFADGTMTISSGTGTGFVSIQSTDFAGNLTGVVKAGSSIAGLAGGTDAQNVLGVTQNVGDNSARLATTAYVMAKVDPSILTFIGTSGGNQTVNLAAQTFSILGTANQIESVGTAQKITFRFPTAGVTLPDGSVATTQALTDNSTDVATTAFVHGKNDAQDLDFTGDTGTSSVLLNSQTLNFEGTANEVVTAVTAQKVKFSLPTDVTIGGIFTGTTFSGDLNGTVNTATIGTTQSAGDDSNKIATTAYVDAAAGAKILQYQGDTGGPFDLNLKDDDLDIAGGSNISTTAATVAANLGVITIDLNDSVTISGTSKADTFTTTAGTATWVTTVLDGFTSITSTAFTGDLTGNASTATALASSGAIALTGDTVSTGGPYTYTSGGALSIATTIADTTVTGKVLTNLATPTSSAIAATDTILAAMAKLQGQITGLAGSLAFEGTWDASAGTAPSATPLNGQFWIVSVAGNTNLDGITDWLVGDWAIYVNNGAGTDAWQKLDQSNEVLGSGAANKIAKWTSTNTLATGLITDDGTTVTVGNSGNFVVEGNTTLGDADTDSTTVKGPAVFEETLRINEGISLGAATYGTAGQVLTSGGGSASVNTWTTPTTGTVTSVGLTETGDALTITGSPVTSSGTINIAGAGASTDYINGELNLVTFPTVDNYQYWILSDGTNTTNITTTGTATFASGAGIVNTEASGTITTAIDIVGTDNAIAGLTAATPIATDTLWFNDISDSNTIRKATIADIIDLGNENLTQVLANGNNSGGTNSINMNGATSSILLPDSGTAAAPAIDQGRIKFGGSADFQIYHNGTHAYLANTTGGLIMSGETNVNIGFSTGENAITAIKDGATSIKYNNLDRVVTSSAGITVTGDQTLNGGKYIGYDGSGSQIQLSRDNTPTIAGHNLGTINFGGENFTSGSNINTATIVAEAEGAWSATNNDTKLTMFLMNGTTSRWVLQAKSNREVDFAGDVDIAGNLTVDGNIINGKGGNYIGDGSFTDGAAAAKLFDIQRANSGALVFDLMLTVGSATNRSIAKKFTVVHAYGATPIFVKTLDTGPDAGIDFAVTFPVSTNTGLQCKIAASGADLDVYYSLNVGHGEFSIVVS